MLTKRKTRRKLINEEEKIAPQGVKSKDKEGQSTSHATLNKVVSQSRFSILEDETLEEMRVDHMRI